MKRVTVEVDADFEQNTNRVGRYWIDSMHSKHELITAEFDRRGWEPVDRNGISDWDFKWTYSRDRLTTQRQDQWLNHFDNYAEIGEKLRLWQNLQTNYDPSQWKRFIPRQYVLVPPGQRETDLFSDFGAQQREWKLLAVDMSHQEKSFGPITGIGELNEANHIEPVVVQSEIDGGQGLWIAKPARGARGAGVCIFRAWEPLREHILEHNSSYVVQKYIETPLLIDGKKFDIRQFVLVASLEPLVVFVHDPFYIRLCSTPYSDTNTDDLFAHLTNHQIQKHKPLGSDGRQMGSVNFCNIIENGQTGAWYNLRARIDRLIVDTLRTWPAIAHRNHSFEVLGFDILLDTALNPWLLEVNTNPGLHLTTPIVLEHHKLFMASMMRVLFDHRKSWVNAPPCDPNNPHPSNLQSWDSLRLLYKGPSLRPASTDEISDHANKFQEHLKKNKNGWTLEKLS